MKSLEKKLEEIRKRRLKRAEEVRDKYFTIHEEEENKRRIADENEAKKADKELEGILNRGKFSRDLANVEVTDPRYKKLLKKFKDAKQEQFNKVKEKLED